MKGCGMRRFDQLVNRSGMYTVKQFFTPECVKNSANLSMWGAEFEFPTAPFVSEAIAEYAKKGLYAYTWPTEEFFQIIADWMSMHRGWEICREWIVPVYGITASVATAMRVFTREGDGIIGLSPGYHMYWEAVQYNGRKKVPSKMLLTDHGYEIDWEDLERKMADPGNKMIVFCNPENPTGKVHGPEELKRIAELAEKHDVIIFNDEIFAECLYDGVEFRTLNQVAGTNLRVITATSLGKWLSFTGTNQANLIIPNDELRAEFMAERNMEFYGSFNPFMIPAYRAAYTKEGEAWLAEMMAYVQENYRLTDCYFREKLPQFKAVKPEGTFVLWVDARRFCAKDNVLNDFLVNRAHFHVDIGSTYGDDEGFFRMNLSIPRAELLKNLNCLLEAANEAKRQGWF